MKHIASILLVFILLTVAAVPVMAAPQPVDALSVIPTISIVSVDPGKTVTVQTHNYPANDTFNVYMGQFGTQGIGGTLVATVNSGAGGSQTYTFNIPSSLASEHLIAIRLQSPTSGYFSYNWFVNQAAGIPPSGSVPAGTIPTISIQSVDAGNTVTVQTHNYPANDTYDVYMNYMGTRGIGGTKVATVNSGTGGEQTFTFTIPDYLKNQQQVAIRFVSPVTGYYSYNWFWNNTAPGVPTTGQPGTVPPGTIPTISIQSVDPGNTFTIQTNNYPANDTFNVYMGPIGTRGIGGTLVTSVNSGTGGSQTYTFTIPDSLKNNQQVAVRLVSPVTGYYSYNWFWNTAGGIPPTGPSVPSGTIPTFSIQSVVRDSQVTI